MTVDLLADLDAGRIRAAVPDATAPGGWRVETAVKAAILDRFADRRLASFTPGEAFTFVDRAALPPRAAPEGNRRIVPGGTTLRAGTHLGDGVVIMPPSYVNVGAYIGDRTMVDSHVLVGSCAQIGADVHLAAGVTIGGVLEPPGARPVIVEDGAFIGSRCILVEGVLVGARAVLGANVVLTASTPIVDVTGDQPQIQKGRVPPESVVIPGTLPKRFPAGEFGTPCALIIGRRKPSTDLKTSLNAALREFAVSV